ncbi:MAG: 1-deoxy-D-xylulose-5-phosphate reductoisomerase [Acidobacteriota bacterium]
MTLRLAILGSTGSIGTSVLEVVRHHPDRLSVSTLAAFGRDPELLLRQAEEFRPALVAVRDESAARQLEKRLPEGTLLAVGIEGLLAAATFPNADRVIAAMVGAAGLPPAHAALAAGKDVALANKESLVVAGRLLTRLAAERGATLLPIDSEHVALHQALRCGDPGEVDRLVLTASGGPFRTRERSTWDTIRPEDALKHPTWSMGAKITIDSATLMNKGLELIEASHLFGVPPERIGVVVHPQSIVHSFVEFRDGSFLAQLSRNDMVFPIQYALSFPERWENRFDRLRLDQMGSLQFEPLDEEKFPTVALARQAFATSDSAPAVMNAANEVAVHAFLAQRLAFTEIVPTIERVLAAHSPGGIDSLDEALEYDRWGRERAELEIARN